MNTFTALVRREIRVALSLKAQPVWFRVVKWACILSGATLYHDRPWFWWGLASLAAIGILVHFLYRVKTKTWTRAWGGWNDLDASRG